MLGDIVILVLLLFINGFFAMAEMAVVSARRVSLAQAAAAGSNGARAALRLLDEPTRFLSTVQIGITLVGVLAGVYSGAKFAEPLQERLQAWPLLARHAEVVAFGVVVLIVTYLSLVVGELVPKRWALAHPERIAAAVALPMEWVARVSAPLVWLLQRSTETLLRLLGMKSVPRSVMTEEEIRALIAEGAREGVFLHAEQRMIDGVLKLADRNVRSIMVPRGDIVWLDCDDDAATVGAAMRASGHSRYLVCRGDLDGLVGVVQTGDLLAWLQGEGERDLALRARPPMVVQESTSILRMLDLFRASALHLAVVVDEHGSVEGIATPTDILAAIAGELPDAGSLDAPTAVRREDESWLIDGRMAIDEVERRLGSAGMARGDDYTTLAGFVLAELGHLPAVGERLAWRDLDFEVVDMDGRRIDQLLVRRHARGTMEAQDGAS
jgi:putative hemolysin